MVVMKLSASCATTGSVAGDFCSHFQRDQVSAATDQNRRKGPLTPLLQPVDATNACRAGGLVQAADLTLNSLVRCMDIKQGPRSVHIADLVQHKQHPEALVDALVANIQVG